MTKKVVRTETVTTESVEQKHSNEGKPVIVTTKVEEITEKANKKSINSKTKKVITPRKKRAPKISLPKQKRMTAAEREEMLIENFVGLQHAMTNLSIKFGSLSDNISNLLMVFEEAARNFAEGGPGMKDNQDMIKKINSLLEQNKTIARGLVLMEGKLRGRGNESVQQNPTSTVTNYSNMSPSVSDMPVPPKPTRQLPSL